MGNIFFIENYKTKNVIDLSSSGGIGVYFMDHGIY